MSRPTNPNPTSLPHAETAEAELIAAIIIDPGLLDEHDEVASLPPEAFYSERNRVIWRQIQAQYAASEPIDLPSLIEAFRQAGTLEKAGGYLHLVNLASEAMGVGVNSTLYAKHVNDTHKRRLLIQACQQVIQDALTKPGYTGHIAALETNLITIGNTHTGTSDREAFELAERLTQGGATITTGYAPIDKITGGFPVGDLTIMAGRTSMGKSAWMHGCAFAMQNCLFLTPDQPKPEIYATEASRRSGVPVRLLRSGTATQDDLDAWRDALESIREEVPKKLEFKDGPLTLTTLRREVMRAAQRGRQAVFVDTLQRIQGESRSQDRRSLMVEITGTLKDLAREYNIAVIAASQLKRDIDERDNKVPMLSDLSESKTIEEDANLVMFLYRDKYYNPNSLQGDTADIIIAKHKTSERQAIVHLRYDGPFMRFTADLTGALTQPKSVTPKKVRLGEVPATN